MRRKFKGCANLKMCLIQQGLKCLSPQELPPGSEREMDFATGQVESCLALNQTGGPSEVVLCQGASALLV